MNKFRLWLVNKFLPAYAREIAKEEIEKLERRVLDLTSEIRKRDAYIRGVKDALRTIRHTTKIHGADE